MIIFVQYLKPKFIVTPHPQFRFLINFFSVEPSTPKLQVVSYPSQVLDGAKHPADAKLAS